MKAQSSGKARVLEKLEEILDSVGIIVQVQRVLRECGYLRELS
jgi:hypothetical protein